MNNIFLANLILSKLKPLTTWTALDLLRFHIDIGETCPDLIACYLKAPLWWFIPAVH